MGGLMITFYRIIALLLIVGTGYGFAKDGTRVVDLLELENPFYFQAGKGLLAMQDNERLRLYSLKNFKLLKSIGKKGEGPGEFLYAPLPQILDDGIMTSSSNKIGFYTFSGKLIEEIKTPYNPGMVKKIGNRYLGQKIEKGSKDFVISYNLFNKNLKVEKVLHTGDWLVHKNRKNDIFEIFFYDVHRERIIFAHRKGFVIEILDGTGKNLHTIRREPEKIPFTGEDYDNLLAFLEESSQTRGRAMYIKKKCAKPDYFPAIRTCVTADGKIYVITYKRKDDTSECLVFDLEGKLEKEIYIPLSTTFGLLPPRITIHQGHLYQLIEDLEKEVWQIHITPLD